ncbi:hypothetical protein SDC9_120456 [bioreactor metagenome]|uniref:Uncharacterized protein n=1 Tax=bioreactor metagenome TaxID=1076179 RepID=A0A645C6Q8_9ZZZZ
MVENDVERTLSVDRRAQRIVYLFSPIQADDDIMHLAVDERDLLVVKRDAVGGNRKMDDLIIFFLQLAPIGDQLFADRPVHQRFAAEEVNLQMLSRSAMFHQKIQRTLAGFQRHEHALAMKISRSGKTIAAAQVTVMRNMQTHGFYRAAAENLRSSRRLRLKRAAGLQFLQIGQHLAHGLRLYAHGIGVPPLLHRPHNREGRVVQCMDGAALYVQQNIFRLKLKCMNQLVLLMVNRNAMARLPINRQRKAEIGLSLRIGCFNSLKYYFSSFAHF